VTGQSDVCQPPPPRGHGRPEELEHHGGGRSTRQSEAIGRYAAAARLRRSIVSSRQTRLAIGEAIIPGGDLGLAPR